MSLRFLDMFRSKPLPRQHLDVVRGIGFIDNFRRNHHDTIFSGVIYSENGNLVFRFVLPHEHICILAPIDILYRSTLNELLSRAITTLENK